MTRAQAIPYIGHAVDDALSPRAIGDIPLGADTVLVGWQCGFEPMFVAVYGTLGRPDDSDAEEMAADYLAEIGWFGESDPGCTRAADFIL